MSDVTEIAAWAWPDGKWSFSCGVCVRLDSPDDTDDWDPANRDDVAFMEDRFIGRGLAEEYGRALLEALWGDCADFDECAGVSSYSLVYAQAAHLATAPLEARVRAMLNVIRAQKK